MSQTDTSDKNNSEKDPVRWRTFSLPNHGKLSSDLLLMVANYSSTGKNGDKLLHVTVNVLNRNPPVLKSDNETLINWRRLLENVFQGDVPLNKISELAESNYVSYIKI